MRYENIRNKIGCKRYEILKMGYKIQDKSYENMRKRKMIHKIWDRIYEIWEYDIWDMKYKIWDRIYKIWQYKVWDTSYEIWEYDIFINVMEKWNHKKCHHAFISDQNDLKWFV